MEKTARITELENKFATRALMIEKVLGSSEALTIMNNSVGFNFRRINNTRIILRVKCIMLWEMVAEMNKLNQ